MFRKIAVLVILMAWIGVGHATGNDSEEFDIPTICAACSFFCEINVATVDSTYPGRDTLAVPVSIRVESDYSVSHVWIKLTMDNGLNYLDLFNNESGGSIEANASNGTTVDFQLAGCSITGNGDYQHLIDLRVSIDDTVSFENFKNIDFQTNSPIVWENGSEIPCDADNVDGGVYLISARVRFEALDTTGFSWQAMDNTDAEKLSYITVPVTYRASFPVDYMKIGILSGDSLWRSDYFYDFLRNDDYHVRIGGSNNEKYLYDDSTMFPADTTVVLGYMRYKGPNYSASYNGDHSFSTSEKISFWDVDQSRVESAVSDHALYFNSFDTSSGFVNFPVYSCTTSISSGTIGYDSLVTLSVTAAHTFPSQTFMHFITFDSTLLTLTDVTAPAGEHAQSVTYLPDGHSGAIKTVQVETPVMPESSKYVGVNTHETIFSLNFAATEKFLLSPHDSTFIGFNTTLPYPCQVYDYYHAAEDKIVRTDNNPTYFVLNGGYVKMPWVFEVSIDTVDCEPDSADLVWVPLRIDKLLRWSGPDAYFEVILPDTRNLSFDNFSADYSDFKYGWFNFDQYSDTLVGIWFGAEINSPGILGHICCKINEKEESGFFRLQTSNWQIHRRPYGWIPGQPEIEEPASAIINGGINPCECGKGLKLSGQIDKYILAPNYPNPFNSNTVISFSLSEASPISVEVMDILGRKVKTLAFGKYDIGQYSVIWDGRNERGKEVTAGVYFYVLRADGYQKTKKMIFLK